MRLTIRGYPAPSLGPIQFEPSGGDSFIFGCQLEEVTGSISEDIATSPQDVRSHTRTHLFVIATLYSNEGTGPVFLRNMSPTGALVEGSFLRDVGTLVRLKRGSLQATASVIWVDGRKAGITFDSPLFVADWMSRETSSHQHRVDEVVRKFKDHADTASCAESTPWIAQRVSIESELKSILDELARLGNALVGDLILVATHPEIQVIDILVQRLEGILRLLPESEVIQSRERSERFG